MKVTAKTTGLRYWMLRVLEQCQHVEADFTADPVHDLRVALRRCRSMADGMMAMDPDPSWKVMKKAGKKLFQRLGALRDVQIMMEWIEKLRERAERTTEGGVPEIGPGHMAPQFAVDAGSGSTEAIAGDRDPVAHGLMAILRQQESEQKREARAALEEFDRKQWRQWSRSLPVRAGRVRPGSAVFKHLALERWMTARDLHTRALRNRSQVAFHTLRIGIKRFRYIVENFLPEEHKAWSGDLKHMQDLLGEVHDLDVLWAAAGSGHVLPARTVEAATGHDWRKIWHERVLTERSKRIDEYRRRTTGPDSLWNAWRAGLPQGKQVREIATRRMKLWARALDPDVAHSEHVARLAVDLYNGLAAIGLTGAVDGEAAEARDSLYLAALLHDVGRSRGEKGHHKSSLDLIKSLGTPLGWKAEEVARAGLAARFHAGALPMRSHKAIRDLLPHEQKIAIQLAAILRLANAMDAEHDGQIRKASVVQPLQDASLRRRKDGFLRKGLTLGKNEAVVIEAEGYTPTSVTAQAIAAERYLLETVVRRPVVVRATKAPMRRVATPAT